jgi:hypothetical protein
MVDLSQGKLLKFGRTEVGISLQDLPSDYPVWACQCGSPLFYIAPNGPQCARCLEFQEIPKPRG